MLFGRADDSAVIGIDDDIEHSAAFIHADPPVAAIAADVQHPALIGAASKI